jgi:threonine dehydratase
VGLFADGCAVAQVGKEPFRLIKEYVDDVITVTTDEICAAVKDIFDDTRAIAEPAGALAVAGMKKIVEKREVTGCSMAATVSGANTNFDRLRYISERTEIGERREAILSVTIPERAGAFRAFCSAIGKRNITEFNYRYESSDCARVFVGLTMSPGDEGVAELQQTLQRKGYQVLDMTDNETAKLHLRHLIGGRLSSDIKDEMVFRVEFPERPGSLLHFLTALGKDYSITLFHYRNHGAAYGRILVGMQVPSGKRASLRSALNRLGYRFWDETDNPAYREHLGRTTT